MTYKAIYNEQPVDIGLGKRKPLLQVKIGEVSHTVSDSHCPAAGEFTVTIDGHLYNGWRYANAEEVYIRINGRTHIIGLPQAGAGGAGGGASADEIRADMPGTVVSVDAKEGDDVTSGQKIMTIESMKLQVAVVAPRDGKIAKIHFAANTTFDRQATLVNFVPLAPAGDDGKKAKS
ncbi:MAG: biotin/lipoyl-binding protein [Rhodospirillaceae bacterium]|nr:biotin/lipoyl-binding protein [Rhodospirillaceae bacterium]